MMMVMMMMMRRRRRSVEQSGECLAVETDVLGESLPQCRFVHHKSHTTWPRLEYGSPRWKAGN
jgi:hypothetical protein